VTENAKPIMFDNDWGLSIQSSDRHYCDNDTFEVAVMHQGDVCNRNAVSRRWGDSVKGWTTADEVTDLLNEIRDFDPVKTCDHRMARACKYDDAIKDWI
jgi:hypothetical protein